MSEGGFQVCYGGPEGKPVGIGNGLGYGFYSINACQQSPIILQFQSATPLRTEPIDEISVTDEHVYNPVLGHGRVWPTFMRAYSFLGNIILLSVPSSHFQPSRPDGVIVTYFVD